MPNNRSNSTHTETRQFLSSDLIPIRIKHIEFPSTGDRLNLVIPFISSRRKSFGGPATALRLFERLIPQFDFARIIVTHETESQVDLHDWPGWVLDQGELMPRSIAFVETGATSLSVAVTDFFMATYWSTAVYVKHIIANQSQFPTAIDRRFVYLIQEYEPALYPGGIRHEYAKSTYRDDGSMIPVFNSRPVANYLRERGLRFSEQYEFEPMLHPELRKFRTEIGNIEKERLILVYGRPGVEQNGFDLIVEALRLWADIYPRADEWALVSAGYQHENILLGGQAVLTSLGTLSLNAYAHRLAQCWAGISFAFNASTSYSAREMAEFGAWVITNQFEYRRTSELPPNVVCLEESTPEVVAKKLAWCCEQYQPGGMAAFANVSPVFKAEGDEFPFLNDLMTSWRRGQVDGK